MFIIPEGFPYLNSYGLAVGVLVPRVICRKTGLSLKNSAWAETPMLDREPKDKQKFARRAARGKENAQRTAGHAAWARLWGAASS